MRPLDARRVRLAGLLVGMGYALAFTLMVVVLVGTAIADRNNVRYHWTELRVVESAFLQVGDAPPQPVELPLTIGGLAAGERLTLSFEVESGLHDNLLYRVNGAALDIYVDDRLYLSTGQADSFPGFQKSPPPQVGSMTMPSNIGIKSVRFEYSVADASGSIEVGEVYLGDSTMLLLHLLATSSFALAIALGLVIIGISLMGVSLLAVQATSAALSLAWLGLTCLAFGLWSFSVNDLAIYLVPYASLLYSLSYIGLLSGVPPLAAFYRRVLARPGALANRLVGSATAAVGLLALALHLSGVLPFAASGEVIRILVPLAMALLGALSLFEYRATHQPIARQLLAPSLFLAVLAICDLVGLLGVGWISRSPLLEVGFLIFTGWMVAFGLRYVGETFQQARESQRLSVENEALEGNLDKQRQLYRQLAESSEQVRAMRHDMRHQLAALRGYLEVSDSEGALDYLDKIGDAERAVAGVGESTPGSSRLTPDVGQLTPTDNFAVNAVVSYYLGAAEAQGIAIDLRLDVPADLGRVSESDISVVFGNLLENAIEASLYLPADQRSIRARCRVSGDRLTLTVDNSFDGFVNVRGGVFYSRKRTGKGIGLSSVRSIVERYDGSMKVEAANGQFMVSLTMRL